MGAIDLASAKLPKNTKDGAIDLVTRQYLFGKGLNFRHGTGHGIGAYLKVWKFSTFLKISFNILLWIFREIKLSCDAICFEFDFTEKFMKWRFIVIDILREIKVGESRDSKCNTFRGSECVKMVNFESLNSPTLISRKIWMTEKTILTDLNFDVLEFLPFLKTEI